jgi:type II secretory pathway component GspD/PulD (secretin)
MLAAILLAIALLIPGSLPAQEGAANGVANNATKSNAGAQPCSDYEKNFPTCGIPIAEQKKAKTLYQESQKLAAKQQFELALEKVKAARAISPLDTVYASSEKMIEEKLAGEALRKGNQAMLAGDAAAALAAFRQAVQIDPSNAYAEQRLHDALPAREDFGTPQFRARLGETRLEPTPGVHSFEYKGDSIHAVQQFAKLFGIALVLDQGLSSRNVRIKLDDVSWETGSQILQRSCKFLIIPISEQQALLANDTEENRRDLTPMTLRTFYSLGGSTPQELTELTTALRVLFDLRFITPNASQGTIVIRAPQQIMDAITSFLEYLQDDRPTVMLEVQVFQISTSFTRDLGTSVPDQFSFFNVQSELNSLVSSSSYQQIVAALQASGQTVNATTILAALLASSASTSSVLGQPFATFGGGLTLSGVTIPTSSLHFSNNQSLARTVDDVLLRTGHGKVATMKVGERYPIVSSQFSASSAATSLLSSLGIGSSAVPATAIPSPQFSYEDLGLVLKATPQVHGKLISLDYELTIRALGATEANGLPDITNREIKGTISTEDGGAVVVAGLVDKSEMASINGIPLLAEVPGLGSALSVQTKEHTSDELLVVIKPHLTSGRTHGGSYIPIPTNIPK